MWLFPSAMCPDQSEARTFHTQQPMCLCRHPVTVHHIEAQKVLVDRVLLPHLVQDDHKSNPISKGDHHVLLPVDGHGQPRREEEVSRWDPVAAMIPGIRIQDISGGPSPYMAPKSTQTLETISEVLERRCLVRVDSALYWVDPCRPVSRNWVVLGVWETWDRASAQPRASCVTWGRFRPSHSFLGSNSPALPTRLRATWGHRRG